MPLRDATEPIPGQWLLDKAAAVGLLRTAWVEGRPIAFDNLENEDVHSDPEFESLRDYFPFQLLLRTD